ncbi:MAG: hypothetical protein AAGH43_00900 [Pseudomonadota bacterium]
MITLARTLTLTTVAVVFAVLLGLWLATTSPANSSAENAAPSMNVETRLGAAELDLCAGQAWPHFSDGCASWIRASSDQSGIDRTISTMVTDADHGFTVVTKATPLEVASR